MGPAILLNKVGKGTALTFAGSPDWATASDHHITETRRLLASAVRLLNPTPRLQDRGAYHRANGQSSAMRWRRPAASELAARVELFLHNGSSVPIRLRKSVVAPNAALLVIHDAEHSVDDGKVTIRDDVVVAGSELGFDPANNEADLARLRATLQSDYWQWFRLSIIFHRAVR